MIKKIAATSFLIDIFVCLILALVLKQNIVLTAFACHMLLIINLMGVYFLWRLVIQKKSIAQGVVLIILKYPLLGYIVVQLAKQNWFDGFGVFIGFASFVFSIVLVTLFKSKRKTR